MPSQQPNPPNVPCYGAQHWTQPPTKWTCYEYSSNTVYGGGYFSRNVVYYVSYAPDVIDKPMMREALGEIRVYDGNPRGDDADLLARFPHYPESMREPPDYPGWTEAKNAAFGYVCGHGDGVNVKTVHRIEVATNE